MTVLLEQNAYARRDTGHCICNFYVRSTVNLSSIPLSSEETKNKINKVKAQMDNFMKSLYSVHPSLKLVPLFTEMPESL